MNNEHLLKMSLLEGTKRSIIYDDVLQMMRSTDDEVERLKGSCSMVRELTDRLMEHYILHGTLPEVTI